jgi:hypothetical protein
MHRKQLENYIIDMTLWSYAASNRPHKVIVKADIRLGSA